MAARTLRRIDVAKLDLPLREPFGIAGGVQTAVNNALVAVELSDGTLGHGEAAPLPAYNGETQAETLALLASAADWVCGRPAEGWPEIGEELARRAGGGCGAARCALETALLDALTRSRGEPLWRYFGGRGTELETDMTIPAGTVDHAARSAQSIRAQGFRTLKIKIGGPRSPAEDLARIEAALAAAPGSRLILDGNAGLTRDRAAELAVGLRRVGIVPDLLEQWLPKNDLAGMRALHQETGWTIAADESVVTAADVAAVARAGAAQVVNLKLMKAGIAEAVRVADTACRAGLRLMIGGNVESILGMTVAACFAAGRGGFAHADLDTPLFVAEHPFEGGFRQDGPWISVAHITAGHGVALAPSTDSRPVREQGGDG